MGSIAHWVYEMSLSVPHIKYFVVKQVWEALSALDFGGSDTFYGQENYANF